VESLKLLEDFREVVNENFVNILGNNQSTPKKAKEDVEIIAIDKKKGLQRENLNNDDKVK
jgi:hypothetical protein